MRLKIALTSTGQGGEVMRTRFAVRLAVTVAAVILAFPPMPVLALSAVCTGTSQVFNANGTAPNGSEQDFIVPAGVTQMTIDAAGAAGGSASPCTPAPGAGCGAELAASFAVTPNDTLNIVVGGAGAAAAGGGGGSFVYTNEPAPGQPPALLIAAAGGGGGSGFFGKFIGGGGGGGYNGGGGGAFGFGGGGGGSYSATATSVSNSGVQSGDGQVSFCFSVTFAGTPRKANCFGQSVSALSQQYGGLNNAAAALGYNSVNALQDAIKGYCVILP